MIVITFLLLFSLSYAYVVDDDDLKTTYYSNDISSCTFNKRLSNVICVNKHAGDIVEYNKVANITFCDVSYCVIPTDKNEPTLCSGVSFRHSNQEIFSFTGSLNLLDVHMELFDVNEWFNGYNIISQNFIQNSAINGSDFRCNSEFGICYKTNSMDRCYGLSEMKLFSPMASLALGAVFISLLGGVLYGVMGAVNVDNSFIKVIVIPFICISVGFFILNGSIFVFKTLPFLLGSFVGVGLGYILVETFREVRRYMSKVKEVQDEANTKMLPPLGVSKNEEEEHTTVELNKM